MVSGPVGVLRWRSLASCVKEPCLRDQAHSWTGIGPEQVSRMLLGVLVGEAVSLCEVGEMLLKLMA